MTLVAIGRPVLWRFTVYHSAPYPRLEDGVLLRTQRGRVYEVLEARALAARWQTDPEATFYALVVVRCDPASVPPERTLWPMHWLPSKRKR